METTTYDEQLKRLRELLPSAMGETAAITIPFYLFHRRMFTAMNEGLRRHDLSGSEIDVLGSLVTAEGETLSPTLLYRRLLFSSGGMTKVLKRLEEKGLIARVENLEDRRSMLVRLTASGRDTLMEGMQTALETEAAMLESLDMEERETFRRLLDRLVRG